MAIVVVAQSGAAGADPARLSPSRRDLERPCAEGRRPTVSRRQRSAGPARTATGPVVCPLVWPGPATGLIAVSSADTLPVELTNSSRPWPPRWDWPSTVRTLTEAIHARRSEARFQTLVQNASDVILIARPDTTITYQTPSATADPRLRAGGARRPQVHRALVHPEDVEQALAVYTGVAFRAGTSVTAEWRVRHKDGSWRHVEVVATNLLSDATVEGIVLTLRDVSERKGLEEELKHQAFHDALSGLANRALFRDRLDHALARAARSKASLAVLFLDLDDFKLVNDSLGHAAGDDLLIAVADRLIDCLRDRGHRGPLRR